MKNKLIVSASPHVTDKATTKRIMLDVCVALIPALIAGVFFFGFYALIIVLVSVLSAVFFEYIWNILRKNPKGKEDIKNIGFFKSLWNFLRKKPNTVSDCSCIVTGLILGLSLPPTVPLYVPVLGGFFAVVIVKMLFGGIGKNFANPAAAARVFLTLAFTQIMAKYILPITYNGFFDFFNFSTDVNTGATISTGATPLSGSPAGLLNLFLGNVGGSIGETSKLALISGGVYLLLRKIIGWEIPVVVIFSFAAFILIFKLDINAVLPGVLSGGLIFAAIFMATDYSTSPNTKIGAFIFAIIIGFFNAFLRHFSAFEEGISFAILLGNLSVPLIDRYIVKRPFGSKKEKKIKEH